MAIIFILPNFISNGKLWKNKKGASAPEISLTILLSAF